MTPAKVAEGLELGRLRNMPYHLQPCCGPTGTHTRSTTVPLDDSPPYAHLPLDTILVSC
jgi:hypothetical protein